MTWTGTCSYCPAAVRLAEAPPEGAKVRCPACRRKQENARKATRGIEDILGKMMDMVNRFGASDA